MDIPAYLRSFGRDEADLPRTVLAELVDSLYGPLGSLVVASTAGAAVAIGVSWWNDSLPADVLAGMLVAVAIGRIVLALAYRLSPRDDDPKVSRRWEWRYAIGAYAFSGCLGSLGFVTFAWTSDPVGHLLLNSMAIGHTAGITGRNSNRLRIAHPQLALILLPIAIGAALRFEPAYLLLSAITLLYFLAAIEISQYLSANYLRLLLTTVEKSELAHSLEEQNLRFDAALTNMSHGLLMLDAERRLVVWNARFCELFGIPPDMVRAGETVRELVTRSVALGNHPGWGAAEIEATVSRYEQRLAGRIPTQSRTQLAGGRIVALSQRPIANGGAVVILEDVTEHDRAEEKSREQEIMFRGLVENGMSGIIMLSTDQTIAYGNPRFAAMLGYDVLDEAIGRPLLDFITDTDKPRVRNAIERVISGRQASADVAATFQQKGGGTIDVLGQGNIATFQGKRCIVMVMMDITERKRSEARIAELNAQMQANLAAMQRHVRVQAEIAKLSDLLQSCSTTTEAYPIIAAAAKLVFPQASGALAQAETGTHELTRVAAWGANQLTPTEFLVEDCWGLRTGQRREVAGPEDAVQCRHFSRTPPGPYICLPLMVQGQTRGLLHLGLGAGGVIDDDLRQSMQSFGDVVKLSLANINLRERAVHQPSVTG